MPKTYDGLSHPSIKFEPTCKNCSLGHPTEAKAIRGSGPDDISKVKLIVLSDYPGYYEAKAGYNQYPNDEERQPKYNPRTRQTTLEGWRNSGSFIRNVLETYFRLDTYEQVWFTNVLKCPLENQTATDKHIRICTTSWLVQEIAAITKVAPNIPILVAGTVAYKGIKFLDPELNRTLPSSLPDARRTTSFRYQGHPLVFTYNPAAVSKGECRVETEVGVIRNTDDYVVTATKPIPILTGSPIWMFLKDIEPLTMYLPIS